jgi:voltage-gated potassium channel
MNVHHRRALQLFTVVFALDLLSGAGFGLADGVGVWNGIYFSIVTVTTVGYGDISPRGWLPHLLAVAIMFLILPLWGTVFSYITAGLTADHVDAKTDRQTHDIKQHVTRETSP